MVPKHSLAIADHAAKLTAVKAQQYEHHNRMDCHVVSLNMIVSGHIHAGDHPLEAVQRFSSLQKVASASCHRVPYSQQDELDASLAVFLMRSGRSMREYVFLKFYVGDAGNTSLVDAGTPLGATTVVTPGSAGYLLWECCILASL